MSLSLSRSASVGAVSTTTTTTTASLRLTCSSGQATSAATSIRTYSSLPQSSHQPTSQQPAFETSAARAERLEQEKREQRRLRRTMIDSLSTIGSTQNRSTSFRPHQTLREPPSTTSVTVSHLLASGAQLGHPLSSLSRAQSPNIYGTRHGLTIIDVEKATLPALKRAAQVVKEITTQDGMVLIVGNGMAHKEAVLKAVEKMRPNSAHVATERWMPGVLTNAPALLTRAILASMRDDATPSSSKSSFSSSSSKSKDKRTDLEIEKEINSRNLRESKLSPIKLASQMLKPSLVIALSPHTSPHALREATALNIPTIALCDSDVDPRICTYPIPCSDDSRRAAEIVLGVLSRAGQDGIREGKKRREQEERRRSFVAREERRNEARNRANV